MIVDVIEKKMRYEEKKLEKISGNEMKEKVSVNI